MASTTDRPPYPVIIDTDPGLDDALAIFLACASAELEVILVTTVAGNVAVELTTANALGLLELLALHDIPVVAGAAKPLHRAPIEAANIHGADGMGGIVLPTPRRGPAGTDAVARIADELARRPAGSVRILALGPLTNLANLCQQYPEAAGRVGAIVAMGGAVRERGNVTPFAEFNIAVDPEAARIVLRSRLPITLVPLDVTRQVAADRDWSARLAQKPGDVARLSSRVIEVYLSNIARRRLTSGVVAAQALPKTFPMHDPCVMLFAIAGGLFGVERLPIEVVTDGSERDGQTLIDKAGVPIDVLTRADAAKALTLMFERLAALP